MTQFTLTDLFDKKVPRILIESGTLKGNNVSECSYRIFFKDKPITDWLQRFFKTWYKHSYGKSGIYLKKYLKIKVQFKYILDYGNMETRYFSVIESVNAVESKVVDLT